MPIRFGSMGATLLVLVATWTSAAAQEFCYGTSDGECLQPDEWPDVCVDGNAGRQSPVDIIQLLLRRLAST